MAAERSALAMLDRATEDALYAKFAEFFRVAEQERRWNLWNDVPWDAVNAAASDELTEAVLAAYTEELFLPDYSSKLIRILRSSRGRAWFLTRWSYEEGKHILALGEWLTHSGKRTDQELKEYADQLLAGKRGEVPFADPLGAMLQALVREHEEIARYRALRKAAEAEGDGALRAVLDQFLADEAAHRAFFRDALLIIKEREPGPVVEAARRVAAAPGAQPLAAAVLEDLAVTPG